MESVDLPFDPNDYNFLVYDPCSSQSSIREAMKIILGRELYPSEIRTYINSVTATDLATHDILIIGWNYIGYHDGLNADDLAAGITGRVILTGHDLDYHTVYGGPLPQTQQVAQRMLVQAIDYVLSDGDTGMITLGCSSIPSIPYLPYYQWGAWEATTSGEDVVEFTDKGLASGIYDGLEPNDMDGWVQSYHDVYFIDPGSEFEAFELGGDGDDIVTIARPGPSDVVVFTKTDDVNSCVVPFETINYTIYYDPNGFSDTSVYIKDVLPLSIKYESSSSGGTYDPNTRTVTWSTPSFGSGLGSVTLVVSVTEDAEPGGIITNKATIIGDSFRRSATKTTCVDCWADIIYVDEDANDGGDGRSWNRAYNDLQTALAATNGPVCPISEIWVAAGIYKPTESVSELNKSFVLKNNLVLIGHFGGIGTYETSPDERNLADSNNTTILEGRIGASANQAVYYVVKAENIDSALVDGFTIRNSYSSAGAGIYLYDSDVSIVNCRLESNKNSGVFANINSCPDIYNCIFFNNSQRGVYAYNQCQPSISSCIFDGNNVANTYGLYLQSSTATVLECDFQRFTTYAIQLSGGSLTLSNSVLKNNPGIGLYSSNATGLINQNIIKDNGSHGISWTGSQEVSITNNLIYNNKSANNQASGIYLYNPSTSTNIRNNTIVDNSRGIYNSSSSTQPNITNCIIWGNTTALSGCPATYSCFPGGTGTNIDDDPLFINPCVGNFHISPDSPCIDPEYGPSFTEDTDIDGEPRTDGGSTDMGADEYYISDYDFNEDAIVDLIDLSYLTDDWLETGSLYNLGGDSDVDLYDFAIFANELLLGAKWGNKYDLNNDYIINFDDFAIFADTWWLSSVPYNPNYNKCCDFVYDNEIDDADLTILAENWLWSPSAMYPIVLIIPNSPPEPDEPNFIEEFVFCDEVYEHVEWLDDLWNTSQLEGVMTYEEYIEFRDAILLGLEDCIDLDDPNLFLEESFYQPSALESSSEMESSPQQEQIIIEDLTDWLDELWQSGDLNESMTYEQYLDFREAIRLPLEQ